MPMNIKPKKERKKRKSKSTDVHGNVTKTTVKGNKKKEVTRVKKEYASNAQPLSENPTVKRKGKKRYVKKTTYASSAQPLEENPSTVKTKGNAPLKMSGKKGSPAHMSRDLSYGGPVIDQEPKALSHMGASKVLKHMKSK
tara:strand:+ start:319 stop:738 length:420 start_codon:yes stop_codon:yes gene_type:complete